MKKWYHSKTLIFNAIVAGLIALEATTNIFKPYVSDLFYVALAVVLPVVNAMLRIVTTQAIELEKKEAKNAD